MHFERETTLSDTSGEQGRDELQSLIDTMSEAVASIDVAGRLIACSAALGAQRGAAARSAHDLVADIDFVEHTVLDLAMDTPTIESWRVRRIGALGSAARRAALAAFGTASTAALRRRMREARHDLTNTIGTVQNAIILMEDEPSESAREHFRVIANRNVRTCASLIRVHLGESEAFEPEMGWLPVNLAELVRVATDDATANGLRVRFIAAAAGDKGVAVANTPALRALVGAVAAAVANNKAAAPATICVELTASNATTALLKLARDAADAESQERSIDLQPLPTLLGFRVDGDLLHGGLRALIPLSPREERQDLTPPHQRQNVDARVL